MSIRVMESVWKDSKQSGGSLLVLLAMADNADDKGICWPGTKYLARKSRMSERQVQRIIDKIIKDGEMSIVKEAAGRGNVTVYRIGTKGDKMSTIEKGKGDICDKERVTSATTSNIKEPSLEPSLFRELVFGQADRISQIFHRRKDTPWNEKEVRAWKKLTDSGKRPIDEQELGMVETFYRRYWPPTRDGNTLRHSLEAFLNNFQGEVDKARPSSEKAQRKAAMAPKPMPDTPPKDFLPAPDMDSQRSFAISYEARMGRLPAGWKRDEQGELEHVGLNGCQPLEKQ